MSEEREHLFVLISSIAYPVFFTTTVVFQSVLIIFIVFFSTPQISFLRVLLLKTSLLHVLVACILFYVQPRILSGPDLNVPVYCYGACRHSTPRACFALYMSWQTMSLGVAISLLYTLYYKYRKVRSNGNLSSFTKGVSMCIFYIPCVISMVCATIIVLRNTLPTVAGKHSEEEAEFLVMGRMTMGEIPNRINFVVLSFGIYCGPLIAFWLRWRTRESLRDQVTGVSPLSQRLTKTVMNGLTLQAALHFSCYIPMFTLYLVSLKTGEQILLQQFFLTLSPNLTATTDPIINLYYVVPYRNRIKRWFGMLRKKNRTMPGVVCVTSA